MIGRAFIFYEVSFRQDYVRTVSGVAETNARSRNLGLAQQHEHAFSEMRRVC
ncbi:hypothetical protein Arad_14209 (plasmid) [Rhizobium rhizogenes K84]|uniref:Uncharacterized protein n=1 Tax=Rhizobium rhizogenes (strain K84 / ATCC BAA-868) TaxID=311403 RepID=B9JPJ4_RHIR8|nr:hypothetical protein Arad_14209 [Rhizobium rhizogenes K84]